MPDDGARVPGVAAASPRGDVRPTPGDAPVPGALAPGEAVPSRDPAADPDASPTPVRGAVRRPVAGGASIDTPSPTRRVPPFEAARPAPEAPALEPAARRTGSRTGPRAWDALVAPTGAPGPDLARDHALHPAPIEGPRARHGAPIDDALGEHVRAAGGRVRRAEITAAPRADVGRGAAVVLPEGCA